MTQRFMTVSQLLVKPCRMKFLLSSRVGLCDDVLHVGRVLLVLAEAHLPRSGDAGGWLLHST
jgi:hypothetical protein